MLDEALSRDQIIFDSEAEQVSDYLERMKTSGLVSTYTISRERLEISCSLIQPKTGYSFHLDVDCSSYRGLPPMFFFSSEPGNKSNRLEDYPKQLPNIFEGGPIFIRCGPQGKDACICVNFNRLAYKEHQGPHEDWGGPGNWLSAASNNNYVRAADLASMFGVIMSRFRITQGRLSDPD